MIAAGGREDVEVMLKGDRASVQEEGKNSGGGWRFWSTAVYVQRRGRRTLHNQGRQPLPLQMTTLARSVGFPNALTF